MLAVIKTLLQSGVSYFGGYRVDKVTKIDRHLLIKLT